jgi:hypothetical protein
MDLGMNNSGVMAWVILPRLALNVKDFWKERGNGGYRRANFALQLRIMNKIPIWISMVCG